MPTAPRDELARLLAHTPGGPEQHADSAQLRLPAESLVFKIPRTTSTSSTSTTATPRTNPGKSAVPFPIRAPQARRLINAG